MEYDTDLIHAAYLKHCYTHAASHSQCKIQCSSLIVNGMAGIVLAAENIKASDWYACNSMHNLIYRCTRRGITVFQNDLYCPMYPTLSDCILLRESGIRSVTFHKEFCDLVNPEWETCDSFTFLNENGIQTRCFSGKVTKTDLTIRIGRGQIFSP